MTESEYIIVFDFPDQDDPLYAGEYKGSLGWAFTLDTAKRFKSESEADRYLANGYGAAKRYGTVCEMVKS